MTDNFGHLEEVHLRDVWPDEALHFTPWLSKNLDRLTEVIGIELRLLETEAAVEPFRVDILARNLADGSLVVIENQLEPSDHTHLGQILTYLAGREAETVIWIASDFQEAHLSAVRWLNENSPAPFSFFAVQVKVMKVGDSPFFPTFVAQERPRKGYSQTRTISSRAPRSGQSELTQWRQEFWTFYRERHPDAYIPMGRKSSNVYHEFPELGLHIAQYIAQDSVGLWIDKMRGSALPQSVVELVAPFVPALNEELEPALYDEIANRRLDITAVDRETWPEAVDWLYERLMTYVRVLSAPPPSEAD